MLDNRCWSIWNLLIASLSFWPASRTDCPIGSWVKAVNSVITTTWSDNLLAVLRTHSLLHVRCIAVAAFLLQPWVLRCALIHLMGSRGRLFAMSPIDWESSDRPMYVWNMWIWICMKDESKINAKGAAGLPFFFHFKLLRLDRLPH